MGTLHWQEKQTEDSDWNEYGVAGDPDSLRCIYNMLKAKGKSYHVRITWKGRAVPQDAFDNVNWSGLFGWYRGDVEASGRF